MTRAALIAALLALATGVAFFTGKQFAPVQPLSDAEYHRGQITCDDRGNSVIAGMLFEPLPYQSDDTSLLEATSLNDFIIGGQIVISFHCIQPMWDR